jgi:hypothetical protein
LANFHFLVYLLLVLVTSPSSSVASSAQRSGFVLLREGIGARAAAMGEAYTAVAGDQTAAYWNPANVAALEQKDFVLAYQRSFQGITQTYGGWAYGNGRRGLALSLAMHSAGGIEARTGPSAEPLGTFGLTEAVAGLSYAQGVGDRWLVGASLRALHESLGSDRASGIGADFGVLFRPGVGGVTLGAAYRNVGRTDLLDEERIPLPRTFRLGGAYVRDRVTVSLDLRFPEHGARGLNTGVEYAFREVLSLRSGYISGHDTRSLSFGLGLRHRNRRIDYAYVPSSMGLEGAHRLMLGIR